MGNKGVFYPKGIFRRFLPTTRPSCVRMMPAWQDRVLARVALSRKRVRDVEFVLWAALAELETVPEADLDEPTRRLRDNTRAMLDRYDRDAYDELVSSDLEAGELLDEALAEQYGRHPAE